MRKWKKSLLRAPMHVRLWRHRDWVEFLFLQLLHL